VIVPSIDIIDGRAVQLRQGREKVLDGGDPKERMVEFRKYGDVAVIDLDAAMGKGSNRELICELCEMADCRVGGGIRNVETAQGYIDAGAKSIIIGTAASPGFLKELPREKTIVALDTSGGEVVVEAWRKGTGKLPADVAAELEEYCSGFLYTIVDKEGMLAGTNLEAIEKLKAATSNRVTAAGGITTVDEIRKLEAMNVDSQLGMAVYSGKLSLADAFTAVVDFDKGGGLVPTIVADVDGTVLMLAYSNTQSLLSTFETGRGTYWSRSRKELWEKGATSGNTQDLVTARYDCDRDTLLFTVRQQGPACHLGKRSCFD
jgi:phosphoribosylformimino-5-aminoimidazole carboxamide ribonucleotide (ProFAR) isomerase